MQTVQQLASAAKSAVGSYLGLTIAATTGGHPINLTAFEGFAAADDILTSCESPSTLPTPGLPTPSPDPASG